MSKLFLTGLFVSPLLLTVGCDARYACPYGEVPTPVYNSSSSDDWVCLPRGARPETKAPASSSNSTSSSDASAPATVVAPTENRDSGSTATGSGNCGAVDATSDVIRIVEKSEAAPAFSPNGPPAANGRYKLVQASFFRSQEGDVGIEQLKAVIDVRGTSLIIGAQNVGESVEANESLTFLLASDGITKVCETRHGNVAKWLFPIATGTTGSARMDWNATTATLRLVVQRPEGQTELVFAR